MKQPFFTSSIECELCCSDLSEKLDLLRDFLFWAIQSGVALITRFSYIAPALLA